MKRLLGIAVLLVSLAVTVNVLALSSATVTNKFTVPVVTSGSALVAVSAVSSGQDADVSVSTSGGEFSLTVAHGVQPNSTYTFDKVFNIKNNSANSANITITASGAPAGTTISFSTSGKPGGDVSLGSVLLFNAGDAFDVKMTVTSASGATLSSASNNVTVVVQADKP